MDFLSRLLDAVATHLEIPRETLDAIEYETRMTHGKEQQYIVSTNAIDQQKRQRDVFAYFRQGCSTAVIAERLGMTQRRVQQIIARNPMP